MTIATTCRRCGAAHEPDHRAIASGLWRLRARCRDAEARAVLRLRDLAALLDRGRDPS